MLEQAAEFSEISASLLARLARMFATWSLTRDGQRVAFPHRPMGMNDDAHG
jgi:hypothetical protein